jgi:CubicO group peptidase (beta-lactamase class C family)
MRRKKMNTLLIKKSLLLSLTIMFSLVILLSLVAPVMAQEDRVALGGNAFTAPSQGQGPTDPAELEAFLDELLAQEMEEYHIAGAAVSVVKDGKLFFAKGYGYADLEHKIPVDPEQTVFRIGSVGKTITWTAVMQLVEQGKLDLEADVNTYLDFRIPDTYPEPIRLKHLMTHTSGFEQRLLGSAVLDANNLPPEREFLISFMPARMRPPGEYISYSNYNAVLAGYIVERVSDQPYDQYIQEHIFVPLGMAHSTTQMQLPPDLSAHTSIGYTYTDGAFQPLPDYAGSPAGEPSGTHASTVTDMARFMIAHLGDGRYSDENTPEARILEESTCRQMHTTLYTPEPHILGNAYGFFDWSDNDQRTIGHQGYLPPMHGELLLLPDQHLGVYVVYNSEGARQLTNAHAGFQRAFFDHYYPAPAIEPIKTPADFAERASRFVGSYRPTDSSGTTAFKSAGIMDVVEIRAPGDGTLLFGKSRFVEVEPLYFRQVDGLLGIAFREDDRGRITELFFDGNPHMAFEKLNWYETRGFNMSLVLGSVLIFLSTIPVAAIRFTRDRRRDNDRTPGSRSARLADWIILGISVLNLLFLAGFGLGMAEMMQNVLLDPPLIIKIALGLGLLAAMLTAGALVYTVLAWKDGYWGVAFRIYYTLVTVAAVAFVWFLNYWNLLGWRY